MRLSSMFGFVVALLAAMAPVGLGGTIYVNGTTGDDTWSGLCETWDGGTCGPKRTIQAGIDVAVAGDMVVVADGTYKGAGNKNIDYGGRNIIVRSSHGAAFCVIDCERNGTGFLFHNGEGPTAVLDGFTIRNGRSDYLAAVYCWQSSPIIQNSAVEYCEATGVSS